MKISVDVSEVPHLSDFAEQAATTMTTWYPKIAESLGTPVVSPPEPVALVIRKTDQGVAATTGRTITVSSHWVEKHPEDLGMVVHELVHVIQAYPSYEPGWVTEGIADYLRWAVYEKMPAAWFPKPDDPLGYRKGYHVTAGFFLWLENGAAPGMVSKLNQAMRKNEDPTGLFETVTGQTLAALWAAYTAQTN